MKRLLVILTLLFVSLNMMACSQKKDSKTRLTKGSGRESGVNNTAAAYGWNMLNTSSMEVYLNHSNPDAAARAFIGNDEVFVGVSDFNSIAMRLSFYNNGQVNPNNSMVGLRFYDDYSNPLTYFLGASVNRRAVSGYITSSQFQVVFADVSESGESLGNVIVSGVIQGNTLRGKVEYSGGLLGEFAVDYNAAVY